jgi:hypothetical protein
VIKRILFATRRSGLTAESFPGAWRRTASRSLAAPPAARPLRLVVCTVLPDVTPDPKHDGISLEWFGSPDHLARYQVWLAAANDTDLLGQAVDVARSPVVIAEEHVRRGEDWLARRWRQGGVKLKHMAIARRAQGLTLAEFFDLWQSRAGRIGTVAIPDEARGLAYIQNWPQAGRVEWAYDALNEVYFDDLDGLQARLAYFQRMLGDRTEEDLVSENWFVAAREEVLFDNS